MGNSLLTQYRSKMLQLALATSMLKHSPMGTYMVYVYQQSLIVVLILLQSNVFINEHGRALIGDFGLTALDECSHMAPTTTINKAGAVRWLSPEVWAFLVKKRT